MSQDRLDILYVSQMPASPPRIGAQARMHGLMSQLGRRHDLTAIALVDDEFDIEECRRAMSAYCREVVLIANPYGRDDLSKRWLQLRSLASTRSFERLRVTVPSFRQAVERALLTRRFDIVNLEFSFLGHLDLRRAPAGMAPPRLVVDSHNIDYDLARQYARASTGLTRRIYAAVNWRKLRREEIDTYAGADGVYLCSTDDQRRLLEHVPGLATAVIPNAADVEYFKSAPGGSPAGQRTIVFFGLMSYVPNVDGVTYFAREIWPRIAAMHPDVRFKIIGGRPTRSILDLAGPRIEVTGFVDDLRPHLSEACVVVVPLRLGGGTRLKIVEAMAMGNAIVSTSIGAEGIDAEPGRELVIEDRPEAFADAVNALLSDPGRATAIGEAARRLAVERYSWSKAARTLEDFLREVVSGRPPAANLTYGLAGAP
jgi:glycosyltransferase involved in cell wall biosynthesis